MAVFQGSGFSVELPDQTVDSSAYTFTFPRSSGFSPSLVIRFAQSREQPVLKQLAKAQQDALDESVADFALVSEVSNVRGSWEYLVSVLEWGEASARIRQKQVFIHVRGQSSTVYTLTTTDLAGEFAKSEPLFNDVIRSFKPNGLQVFEFPPSGSAVA